MQPVLDSTILHSGIPTECVSANTIAAGSQFEYPGIAGTGFFARRERQIFYFTAMHCVRAGPASPRPALATLMIPYRHTGRTASSDDFVQFESAYTLEQFLDGEWQDTVDLITCPVKEPSRSRDLRHLLGRSAKLPPSADWMDTYLASPAGSEALARNSLAAVLIGFPRGSPNTFIAYADTPAESLLRAEALVVPVTVGRSSLTDCFAIEPAGCPYPYSGFSGSPVFARVAPPHGPQYTLIGMVVCGSTSVLHVLRVGRLLEAAIGDDQPLDRALPAATGRLQR